MDYCKLLRSHHIDPDDGVMTVDEFTKAVTNGLFTDDDGIGFYATETEYYWSLPAVPSLFSRGLIWDNFTHVVWFNK